MCYFRRQIIVRVNPLINFGIFRIKTASIDLYYFRLSKICSADQLLIAGSSSPRLMHSHWPQYY
jgi:hypothetical protein